MNSPSFTNDSLTIAVPCYGTRVLPRFGQAREFFFAEVGQGKDPLRTLQRHSWDIYQEPQLARWLGQRGVQAVLCGGIHPRFQLALTAEGIQVVWGFRGEVEDVLRQWLQERRAPQGYSRELLIVPPSCQLRETVHERRRKSGAKDD